jgi:hypothetical protein
VFGLGGIGLNVIQGLRLAGADMIIGVDLNNAKKQWGERFGMTHFVNPKEVGSDLVAHLVNMTKRGADQIGGADYTFDCTGNVTVMRQALEACHRGWGQSIIIGVAPAGAEIATRPFRLVTAAFGRARHSAARVAAPMPNGMLGSDNSIVESLRPPPNLIGGQSIAPFRIKWADQNSAGKYPLISRPIQISTSIGVVQAIRRFP